MYRGFFLTSHVHNIVATRKYFSILKGKNVPYTHFNNYNCGPINIQSELVHEESIPARRWSHIDMSKPLWPFQMPLSASSLVDRKLEQVGGLFSSGNYGRMSLHFFFQTL